MGAGNRRTVVPILLLAVAILVAAMGALGLMTFRLLNKEVVPALEDNARVIGGSVQERIAEAVELGIPIEKQVGVNTVLAQTRERSPAIAALVLTRSDGTETIAATGIAREALPAALNKRPEISGRSESGAGPLATLADTAGKLVKLFGGADRARDLGFVALPIEIDGTSVGTLHVGIDQLHVAREVRATAIDVGVVMVVALLVAFEALLLVIAMNVGGPLSVLMRLAQRIARRDFSREAPETGAPAFAQALAAMNNLVRHVNAAAGTATGRIRDGTAAGARMGAAAASRLEQRIAAIGTFISGGNGGAGRLNPAQLVNARGTAFLFVLAEELLRPFLPLYISDIAEGVQGVDPALLIAIPISAFMIVTAIAGPVVAAWSDRVGRRRTFLVGALISTAGLVGTAFPVGFADFVFWRALSGLGYALTFVACQGHVLDQTTEEDRTRGLSVFVGGIMAADICGPAIGGILADQIGYAGTVVVAAGVALLAAVLALRLMSSERRTTREPQSALASFRTAARCATNPRFAATVLLAAIPAKMLLTGFLFYLAPLILSNLGVSESQIGRMTMVYGISALLLMPLFASICDRFRAHGVMVGVGALIAGTGLIPFVFGASVAKIAVAILLIGVGQAMSISAQTAFVTIVGRGEIATYGPSPVLGAFRLAERLGSAAGPLVAAQIANSHGYITTATAFGFAAVTLGTLFSALFMSVGVEPEDETLTVERPLETQA